MNKEELRNLIQNTRDEKVSAALWELYELKFCKQNQQITWNTFKRSDLDNMPMVNTSKGPDEKHNTVTTAVQ